jgi:hypothetical protein
LWVEHRQSAAWCRPGLVLVSERGVGWVGGGPARSWVLSFHARDPRPFSSPLLEAGRGGGGGGGCGGPVRRPPGGGWWVGGRGVVVRCRVDASIESSRPRSDRCLVDAGLGGSLFRYATRCCWSGRAVGWSGWAGGGGCLCVVWLVVWSSCQGRTVDALAPGADEGRGSLRYAPGSWQPSCDPGVSEWGNPAAVMGRHHHLNA